MNWLKSIPIKKKFKEDTQGSFTQYNMCLEPTIYIFIKVQTLKLSIKCQKV